MFWVNKVLGAYSMGCKSQKINPLKKLKKNIGGTYQDWCKKKKKVANGNQILFF